MNWMDYWGWIEYYLDTFEDTSEPRPCTKCGKMPTIEGYDACWVSAACWCHGVEEGYILLWME